MAEELGERTEQPTPRRRFEARRRGQVAKSQDLASAIQLAAAVTLILVFGAGILSAMVRVMRRVLESQTPGSVFEIRDVLYSAEWAFVETVRMVAPVMLIIFAVTYAAGYVQVGWLVTFKPLRPRMDRLNPVTGLKRLFNKRSLVKTTVNTGKLILILIVVALLLRRHYATLASLSALAPAAAGAVLGTVVLELVVWLLALMLLIGLVDMLYQRWQHTEDLRMTKQQVQDERKMMEGDPQVKKRRLKIAMQLAMHRIHRAVPQADVIITNPSHFSVALKYNAESMGAPRLVAKGADYLAFRIRELARAHGVPIVERPPLARAIYWGVEVGREIPPEHYEAVAEVLAYVYRLEERAA